MKTNNENLMLKIENSQVEIGKSITKMFHRETKRVSHGHYKKSLSQELWSNLWMLAIILAFISFAGLVIWGSNGLQYYIDNWQNLTFMTFLLPISIYVFLKISLIMRWCLYWCLITTGLLFLFNTVEGLSNVDFSVISFWIFVGFVCLESMTVLFYMWIQFIHPMVVLHLSHKNPWKFWDIQPTEQPGHFKCRRYYGFGKSGKFSYIGEVNDRNEPHGFGNWTSQWNTGEVLTGLWENGYPIGPFKSREYASGFSFANVRIGFVSTDAGNFDQTTTARNPSLRYGVAGVETSATGKFIAGLPVANLILDPYSSQKPYTLGEVISKIVHFNDISKSSAVPSTTEITIRAKRHHFEIVGYEAESAGGSSKIVLRHHNANPNHEVSSENRGDSANIPQDLPFSIEGWRPLKMRKECAVFITGFNCSAKSALESFGGMITLGALASRIVPIVYKWNGGSLVDYWAARKIVYAKETIDDFIKFLGQIKDEGFTKIHILCHSMGANLVTNCARRFDEVFENIVTNASFNDRETKSYLASVTFLNPETPLKDFREKHFYEIKQFTPLITLYGSNNDVALWASEKIFSRMEQLGCHIHGLVKSPELQSNNHSDTNYFTGSENHLDMDVIDTTYLDINIHLARHMYFNVNKFIIDDVVDLLSTGQRAANREHRLLSLGGNIYAFLAAPSFVVR